MCITNGTIALLFQLQRGMFVLGKNPVTGQIPWWSYLLWAGFHLPTTIYTRLHHAVGKRRGVPAATEVAKGFWVGGRYSHELQGHHWAAVVDVTCEFPETCMAVTAQYLLMPSWDGVPLTPAQLEAAAQFCVAAAPAGDVLVHCAHGRGRSTTVMCAVLVTAGVAATWQDAFKLCQAARPVVLLNKRMRAALTEWQAKWHRPSAPRTAQRRSVGEAS
eukprot:EG_transcript_21945